MTFKLSPSSLNLMKECPRCFWLAQHSVWKRPTGPFPQLPNGMDRVLKVHFDKFMRKSLLPPELCNHNHCENMKLFDNEKLLAEWRYSRKGLWFEDKDGNILHGGLDNILVKGKKLIVLDYKTKGSPAQLTIYNFLLRKMGYETLQNIIDFNREQARLHPEDEDLENDLCPYDAWTLKTNSRGYKSCEICGRIWLGNKQVSGV